MLPGYGSTLRVTDIYPGSIMARGAPASYGNAASAPSVPPAPGQSPAIVLIAIVVLLVAVRLVYEAAPAGGKGV